ncbi:glutamate ABC transporter substrate-binding protein [Actinomadura rudentiformis]|uniref:Glutamate ABC transporter substrate-binding protein n=1 Tax=Actinomadura rudentiformis TaxID=359158 RepID=A0A6H9YX61_9ACTN|nr:glutamate ABC transporter substrate-binding protein [Actinomadura rudentiformis]KAB2344762.1 glutamate ABC transporter substrate-binding protein [Actinomadura rudentiformis]
MARATGAVILTLALTGCTAAATASQKKTIVVGVKSDQPGLGLLEGGSHKGFEVDVGTYIARRLGATRVTFQTVTSEDRERQLGAGRVDLVLASYSITAERATKVTFGGPYYVAHQDIMIRRNEQGIRSVRDLRGRRMCEASGSVSTQRVTRGLGITPRLVPSPSYSDCFKKLLAGQVDAVSTGDLVLAGFAARAQDRVRITNTPFTDERYGVGLRKGDVEGCERVNKAITQMYQDGTASRLLRKWFGPAGLQLTESVPEFEGCS